MRTFANDREVDEYAAEMLAGAHAIRRLFYRVVVAALVIWAIADLLGLPGALAMR